MLTCAARPPGRPRRAERGRRRRGGGLVRLCAGDLQYGGFDRSRCCRGGRHDGDVRGGRQSESDDQVVRSSAAPRLRFDLRRGLAADGDDCPAVQCGELCQHGGGRDVGRHGELLYQDVLAGLRRLGEPLQSGLLRWISRWRFEQAGSRARIHVRYRPERCRGCGLVREGLRKRDDACCRETRYHDAGHCEYTESSLGHGCVRSPGGRVRPRLMGATAY
jgi:hypothetical protein